MMSWSSTTILPCGWLEEATPRNRCGLSRGLDWTGSCRVLRWPLALSMRFGIQPIHDVTQHHIPTTSLRFPSSVTSVSHRWFFVSIASFYILPFPLRVYTRSLSCFVHSMARWYRLVMEFESGVHLGMAVEHWLLVTLALDIIGWHCA